MPTFGERTKDWWIKGMQLHPCYIEDWDYIKSTFSKYGLNMNAHGPIITMNEAKYVREAAALTESSFNKKTYKEIFKGDERERKSHIFVTHLSTFPYFARELAFPLYKKWISSPDKYFNEIVSLNGTMKKKDKKIEQIIENAIIFLSEK
jgi:hypothetical protein